MKKKLVIFFVLIVGLACLWGGVKNNNSKKSKIPYEAHMLLNEGVSALKKGETLKAIDTFSDLTRLYPNVEKGYYNLGVAYTKNNQPLMAIKAWEQVLKINTKNDDARYNLAIAYDSINQQKTALKYIDEYLKKHPDDKSAKTLKSSILNTKTIDMGQGIIGKIALNCDKNSKQASSVFDKKTRAIYCHVEVFTPQKPIPFGIKWFYIARDNTRLPVNEFTYGIKQAENFVLTLSRPKTDWPIGHYETVIMLNNKKTFTIPFEIK